MEKTKLNTATEKTFVNSKILISDRKQTSISGVEKIFEASETKMIMKVSGSNMAVLGEQLNISKLDVDAGTLELNGQINEIKFVDNKEKISLIKKIFK